MSPHLERRHAAAHPAEDRVGHPSRRLQAQDARRSIDDGGLDSGFLGGKCCEKCPVAHQIDESRIAAGRPVHALQGLRREHERRLASRDGQAVRHIGGGLAGSQRPETVADVPSRRGGIGARGVVCCPTGLPARRYSRRVSASLVPACRQLLRLVDVRARRRSSVIDWELFQRRNARPRRRSATTPDLSREITPKSTESTAAQIFARDIRVQDERGEGLVGGSRILRQVVVLPVHSSR